MAVTVAGIFLELLALEESKATVKEDMAKNIERIKELQTFQVTSWGKTYDVRLKTSTYTNNGNLYVGLVCKIEEDGEEWWEPYCDLTVNIRKLKDKALACLDVNNFPEAEEFVTENKLATFTGDYEFSGFCVYPIYKFDTHFLELLTETYSKGE